MCSHWSVWEFCQWITWEQNWGSGHLLQIQMNTLHSHIFAPCLLCYPFSGHLVARGWVLLLPCLPQTLYFRYCSPPSLFCAVLTLLICSSFSLLHQMFYLFSQGVLFNICSFTAMLFCFHSILYVQLHLLLLTPLLYIFTVRLQLNVSYTISRC